MATRQLTKHNGDIGEVNIVKDFLLMGAAVNSLTGSDYGLDLHIQVPLRPQEYKNLKESWPLSGRIAHAQVKNMTSGQNPPVAVGRLRGWIAGSQVGSPTFVIILKTTNTIYLSPRDLMAVLKNWEVKHAVALAEDARRDPIDDSKPKAPGTVTLGEKRGHEFEPASFPWLLHLWTKYPGVMMNHDLKVQDWLDEDELKELERLGARVIFHVLLAWMKSHYSDTTPALGMDKIAEYEKDDGTWLFEGSECSAGALKIVQAGFRALYPDESHGKVEERGWEVMSQLGIAWLNQKRYPLADLMTSYSISPHAGQSLDDAVRLLADIMEFNRLCRAPLVPVETESDEGSAGPDPKPA